METWDRTSTRTVDGTLVSVFEKTYSGNELADHLGAYNWGFDDGGLFWGAVISPGTGTKRFLSLRIGTTNLPTAAFTPTTQTIKLADDVQFAGSVVNLKIPGFGDSRVADGSHGFDLEGAAKKFYEHFPDAFDSLAFIPQSQALASYSAFHRVVKNEVTGIGLLLRNDSADYGSAGRLQGVEAYAQTAFSTHSTSIHEMIHQWANFLEMPKLADVEAKGHRPDGHTALTPGTTLAGAVVDDDRTVSRVAETLTGSDFEITQTQYPLLFHPQEMYALGGISMEELGTQLIFDNQGQFDPEAATSPDVGTKLIDGIVEVTTGAILGQHGAWGGPILNEWHRATIVVSRDELLSDVEMNYWSFFSQRGSDPNRTGVPSFDGYVSWDGATDNKIDLKSEVVPKSLVGLALGDPLVEVTNPEFGSRDIRGLTFGSNLPSKYSVNQTRTLTGTITEEGFVALLLVFTKSDSTPGDNVEFFVTPTNSGTFSIDVSFSDTQAGLYRMTVLVAKPTDAFFTVLGHLTPILVE